MNMNNNEIDDNDREEREGIVGWAEYYDGEKSSEGGNELWWPPFPNDQNVYKSPFDTTDFSKETESVCELTVPKDDLS